MSGSHIRLAVRGALVAITLAVSVTAAATAQQKPSNQPQQQNLDKWESVPFCGSVSISRNGSGKATVEGVKWEKSEFGQLTANITGAKDKVNQRSGKVSGFFVEGTVNMTYGYNETAKFPKDTWTWKMQANGQKQHTYGPGEHTWTDLLVNKAQGLYRFRPPGGTADGTMTYTNQGGSKTQRASFEEWHAPVGDKDRRFDPKTGVISGSDKFICWNLIGIKDFFGREGIFCDVPQLRSSEKELPKLQEARDAIAKLPPMFRQADPARLRPVTFTVNWNLNLDTGGCQKPDCEGLQRNLRNALKWLEGFSNTDLINRARDAEDYSGLVDEEVTGEKPEPGKSPDKYETDANVNSNCELGYWDATNGEGTEVWVPLSPDGLQDRLVSKGYSSAGAEGVVTHEGKHMDQCSRSGDSYAHPKPADLSRFEREAYCAEAKFLMDYLRQKCGGVPAEMQQKFDKLCR